MTMQPDMVGALQSVGGYAVKGDEHHVYAQYGAHQIELTETPQGYGWIAWFADKQGNGFQTPYAAARDMMLTAL